MNLFILLILTLTLQYGSTESECLETKENDRRCGAYCYQVVKPLLNYAASVRSKEEQFHEQEMTIKKLESDLEKKDYEHKLSIAKLLNEHELPQQCSLITKHEKDVKDLQNVINDYKASVEQCKNDVKLKEDELQQQRSLNDAKENEVEDLKTKIQTQDSLMVNLKENIKALEENIKRKDEELQQQRTLKDAKENEVEDLKTKIQNQAENIKLKDDELEKQRTLNDAKEKEVQDLKTKVQNQEALEENIKRKDEELQQQRTLNDAKEKEVEDLKIKVQNQGENIKQKDDEYQKQRTLNDAKEKEVEELKTKIREQEEKIEQSKAQLQDIQNKDTQLALNADIIKRLESKFSEFQLGSLAANCLNKSTDVYMFNVPKMENFNVPCDSNLTDSGWTVFQRRVKDSVIFNRTWEEYKTGFGDLHGDFFLGLDKLYLLTQLQRHELYIHIENENNEIHYVQYDNFVFGNETESYELKMLGEYSGNAGDSLSPHITIKFSTPDRDNDNKPDMHCAQKWSSGWWFRDCFYSIGFNDWHFGSRKFVQMMIRPKLH